MKKTNEGSIIRKIDNNKTIYTHKGYPEKIN